MTDTNIQNSPLFPKRFKNGLETVSKRFDNVSVHGFGKNPPVLLDTLAQLVTSPLKPAPLLERSILEKRARSKHISNNLVLNLVDLGSPLKKSYWNTYHCNAQLSQNGKQVKGKFCNNRWCLTCNRVRTAKLIKGYETVINTLPDKQMLTLTIPNVKAPALKTTIDDLLSELKRIQRALTKRGVKPVGIRKMECTYNASDDSYHPHFHLLISGRENANAILNEWLKRFPEANRLAQDIRSADDNSARELFKYFTKIATYSKSDNKRKIYTKSLDVIFRAMRGRRVFQPMGVKKFVSEDIEEIQAQEYNIEESITTWEWKDEFHDWVDLQTGEVLTGYKPSEGVISLLQNIVSSP